ncbi:Glycoside hydrolase [Globisporangium polare]
MLRSFRQVLAAVALCVAMCSTSNVQVTHAAAEELCSLPPDSYTAAKSSDPNAAFALTELQKHSIATWYSDRNGDFAATLTSLLSTCSEDKRLSLVVYGLPNKDCEAGYSSGGTIQSADDYAKFLATLTSKVGTRKALYVLEPDAVGLLAKEGGCGESAGYRANLKTAVKALSANPNAEIYLDVGYWTLASDDSLKRVVAVIKELADAGTIKGITINTSNYRSNAELSTLCTNFQVAMGLSTYKCIVDTSRNYNVPTSTEWCNVKTAGIGHPPTSETGYSNLDYFMWVKPPGESDGTCTDGSHTSDAMQGPAAGKFYDDAFTLLWNQGYFVKELGMAAIGDSVAPTPAPTTTSAPETPTPSSTSPVQQYPTPEPTTTSPVTITPVGPTPAPTTTGGDSITGPTPAPTITGGTESPIAGPTPAPTTSSPTTITPCIPTPAPTTLSPMTVTPDVPTPAPTTTGGETTTGPTPAPTTTGGDSITGPTTGSPIPLPTPSPTPCIYIMAGATPTPTPVPTPAPTSTGGESTTGPTPAPTTTGVTDPTPAPTPCIYIMAGATPAPTPSSTTGSAISDDNATVMPTVEPTQPLPAPTPASTQTSAAEASSDGDNFDFDIDESSDSGSSTSITVPTPAPTSLRGNSDSVGVEYDSSTSGDNVKQVSTQSSTGGSGTTAGILAIVGVIGVVAAVAMYMNSRAKKKMMEEPKESPVTTSRACEVQSGTYLSAL